MLHLIENVRVAEGSVLELTYAGGETVVVDISPLIERGGVFSRLADPAVFARVVIGGGGRYLEWPGEIDLCADSLWLSAHERDGREAA
ncbi:MAG TPA: DUF2442 domain-containing protein [Longimicrobiaceae bacterium]|nr:DUF2442 domain-containing protein [Longimicrobiaceae bacterium]